MIYKISIVCLEFDIMSMSTLFFNIFTFESTPVKLKIQIESNLSRIGHAGENHI